MRMTFSVQGRKVWYEMLFVKIVNCWGFVRTDSTSRRWQNMSTGLLFSFALAAARAPARQGTGSSVAGLVCRRKPAFPSPHRAVEIAVVDYTLARGGTVAKGAPPYTRIQHGPPTAKRLIRANPRILL